VNVSLGKEACLSSSEEMGMQRTWNRVFRWLILLASGGIVLQAGGCDTTLQFLQTGLLGGITGMLYFLSRIV
jgi:hypothetical protein